MSTRDNPSDVEQEPAETALPVVAEAREPTSGLSPAQLSEADQVGKRLVDDFRPIFEALPAHAKTGLGLARYLEIDRGTATRFISVYTKQITGLDVFHHFPGLKGLAQILDALAGKGIPSVSLVSARSALARFERLVEDLGITQTKLNERIAATRSRPENHDKLLLSRRRTLFKAAAESLGQSCETVIHVHASRPSTKTNGMLDRAFLQSALGYRAREDAPPFAFRVFTAAASPGSPEPKELGPPKYEGLGDSSGGSDDPRVTVLREFSSDPPPVLSPRNSGQSGVVIIDSEHASEQRGLDLTVGQQVLGNWAMPDPTKNPDEHYHGVRIDVPTKRILFEVYYHHSMASRYVPRTAIFRMTPSVMSGAATMWYDQLPYPPPLQVISCTPIMQGSRFHSRQSKMVGVFFDKLKWPLDEFIGYRIEVEYPQFSALYRMIFRSVPVNTAE